MDNSVRCSIVMATRNKAEELDLSLKSIFSQKVPFAYEVIVVDDGSTDNTAEVCKKHPVKYFFLKNDRYRNPSRARNTGYKQAKGEVIIAQSDDVIHRTPNAIQRLVEDLRVGEFLIAEVHNYEFVDNIPSRFILEYSGLKVQNPYFFLGALWRTDLYAVGGNDEQFVEPCYDDNWFADCLIHGLGLTPHYTKEIKGYHQNHTYPKNTHKNEILSKELYARKVVEAHLTGIYKSSDGPWPTHKKTIPIKQIKPRERFPIPKRMSFFWASETMSWLRYMTLKSFRHFHPNWEIVLYRMPLVSQKTWNSHEVQDCDIYHGPDYTAYIEALDIKLVEWKPPIENLAPPHASDICQWEILSTVGGFYADMDILWIKPIDYEQLCGADVIYCLSGIYVAIGFFGASPDNVFFSSVYSSAINGFKASQYQNTGAEAIYRLAGIPKWGPTHNVGEICFRKMAKRFNLLKFVGMPQEYVYPFYYTEVKNIFNKRLILTEECCGIHWFGGSKDSQAANSLFIGQNYESYPCTFSDYARRVLGAET